MLLRPFGRLLALACVTWACAQEAPVPTHLKVKATFTRTDKDGKPEVVAQPSVITVDGKRATITVGNAEEGVLLSVVPKVNADGSLTLDVVTETREPPAAQPSPAPATARPAAPAKAKGGIPLFHGVLPADKLFSIEDAAGARKWLPLGRKVDGWTLRAYDEKRQALTLTRLGESRELVLHQAVIEEAPAAGPSVRRSETRLTLPKGQTAKLGGGQGQEVTLEAEILDFSK
jgi:hypothetical protein